MTVCLGAWAAEDAVVARLNGQDIKFSKIEPLVSALDPGIRAEAAKNPEAFATVVRAQLGQVAVLEEAEQKQWDQRPEIQQKIRQATDAVVATTYLAASAPLPTGYPSEAEVSQAYDQNRQQFVSPRQYHLAQIFIPAAGDPAKAEQTAKTVATALKAKPTDFAGLADQYSSDPEHKSAGDLGWTAEDRVVPEVRSVVQGMSEGEISEPIRTLSGFHIVELLGTRPAGTRPLGEVHDTIVNLLRQKKQQEEEKRFVEQLLVKDQAAINEIALKQALEQTN